MMDKNRLGHAPGRSESPKQNDGAGRLDLEGWDTASVSLKDRFSYFREAVCQTFLHISPEEPETKSIDAQIKKIKLAGGTVTKLAASPHFVQRTQSDLSYISEEVLSLSLQLTGANIFRTGTSETKRSPGDITLNYCNDPFSIEILPGEPYTHAGLFFKKSTLLDLLPMRDVQIANIMLSRHDLAPALAGCLSALNNRLFVGSRQELSVLCDAAISLVAASLLQDADFMEATCHDRSNVREGIFVSIKSFIEKNLRDQLLSPVTVAAQFSISVSYLHRLFAATPHTFGGYVLSRRLEHAKIDLGNAARHHISIAEIAYHWGFRDLSSFHRNFKSRFDATPRQMRRATMV